MSPADLPHGVSPDCQDVIFSSGGVATRPGLAPLFGLAAHGIPTVNYVKTYETLTPRCAPCCSDSNGGALNKETTARQRSLTVAAIFAPNSYAHSASIFGREYLAISDGKSGIDLRAS